MSVLLVLAGCSTFGGGKPPRIRPTFSPNGELLHTGGRGAPECSTLVGAWWDRIAALHAGGLDKATFLADAETQFATMDLDHDGFITSSELSDYRAGMDEAMRDEVPAIGPDGKPLSDIRPNQLPQESRRGNRPGETPSMLPRTTHYGSQIPADMVDPVMSADRSLSFKVSREDFMVQAHEVFLDLDKDRDGRLSRDEVIAACPARP
jgi:hypothetical protein